MSAAKITKLLKKALLENGEMSHALYEHELKEQVDYLYKGLKRDKEDVVFVVTENTGDVAMVLTTRNKTVYINEDARQELMKIWQANYANNVEMLIPSMVRDLVNDFFAVTGVKVVKTSKPKKAKKGWGFG
ncbi:hypothetical protein IQ273_00080 [Nodosilinea sp. LEGE 07298]|uniref:hypothetical protein n=1 Tax=Nodosilinea sp. LEGE 07298 TaxID=2777970 RepID=UPI00187E9924|nr:hypothetical protein [Nodosilinea sp. LEGE 07298]MBE9107823.1 hypothetical protein [Nodosilinea sp. LEGE 07298]